MKNKIFGIFVMTLLILTCVVPVLGETINLKKSCNDINALASGTTSLEFMIAGNALRCFRSYWLHVPPSYDGSEAVPLVIVLHCLISINFKDPLWFFRSSWIENYTEFSQKSDEKGFIVVYPNAKFLPRSSTFSYNPGYLPFLSFKLRDDVGFISDLINKMKEEYTINSSRIYVAGFSNGGIMSYSLGAYLSDTIAAIAPVAGTIGYRGSEDTPFYSIPSPTNPVSIIVFHGTNDSSDVTYNGSSLVLSVNQSIAFWVEHNRCDPTPEIYTSPSGKIIRRTYTDGENGTEVILYTTVSGDHWWPGTHWDLDYMPDCPWLVDSIQEISATDLIWDFFEAHPKQ